MSDDDDRDDAERQEETNPRPHPSAWPYYVLTWAFTCAGCGKGQKFGWHEVSDETGERLYCYNCAHGDEVKAPHATYETPAHRWERVDRRLVRVDDDGATMVTRTPPLWQWCRRFDRVFPYDAIEDRHDEHVRIVAAEQPATVYQCAHCRDDFTPARSDAVYCSTRCRVAAWRAVN